MPRPTPCDPDRLRRLLDDRLDEAEGAAMADHLAACDGCRRTLDRMAAGTRWWRDARAFLAEPSPDHDATSPRPDHHEPDDPLDFLAPSDDPAHLGRIGPYEVVDVIGRGGMGLVLKALDPSLNRFVAIKVLAPELATSASARRRFAREGQAAAAICHDHVVAIHAVDASGGLPYLVMQYVAGKSLQDRIDGTGPLLVEEIVRIGMQAARGLEAAHAVGLIHRDVKPSNILLENGVERVKLVDFGLARAADDASLTQSGVVAGTPQYMSPEQAGGEPVDHRADLFSLGSVLYALCTGRPPFRAESTMAVLRRVSDDTPRPIRELNPEVPDWLEAIVMKLHAKDPAERFQTSSEVALLLGRCLAYLREPRRGAPPPYAVERPKKPRRRRLVIASVALLALVALGAAGSDFVATVLRIRTADGVIVIRVNDPDVKVKVDDQDVVITGAGPQELRVKPGMHTIESARGGKVVDSKIVTVERGGKQVVEVGFERGGARPNGADPTDPRDELARFDAAGIADAMRAELGGELEAGRQELARMKSLPRPAGDDRVKVLEAQVRRLEMVAAGVAAQAATPRPADPSRAAVSADGRPLDARVTFMPGTRTQVVPTLSPIAQDRLRSRLPGPAEPAANAATRVSAIAFTPDGQRIAVAGGVPTQIGANPAEGGGLIGIWEPQKGTLRLTSAPEAIRAVAFAPDGKTIVTGEAVETSDEVGGDEVRVYESARLRDAETGRVVRGFRHRAGVRAVASSPDGHFVATGSEDGQVTIFEVASGRSIGSIAPEGEPVGPVRPVAGVAFAPDGRRLFAWTPGGAAGFWTYSAERGVQPASRLRIPTPFDRVALSPDGATLVTSGLDGSINLLDVRTGEATVLQKRGPAVSALAFSPDGTTLASAGSVGIAPALGRGLFVIMLWDVASRRLVANLDGPSHRINAVAFSPDGHRLAAGGVDGTVRLWDLASVALPAVADGRLRLPGLPDARDPFDPLKVPMTGRREHADPGADMPPLPFAREPIDSPVRPSSDSPAADPLAVSHASRDLPRPVSPRRTPEPVPPPGAVPGDPFVPIRPQEDAGGLAVGRRALPDGARPEGEPEGNAVLAMATAPDGKTIATGSEDGVVRILDAATRRVVRELKGHSAPVRSVAYSPDGKVIASAASDKAKEQAGEVLVRSVADGRSLWNSGGKAASPLAVAFSPDGTTLAIGRGDGQVILRRLLDGMLSNHSGHHGKAVRALAFGPDGKTFASGGDDGNVEVRKADGTHLATRPGNGTPVVALAFSPDGKRIAAGGGRSVIVHDGSKPGVWGRTPFVLRQCEVLSLAFSPDGASLAAAGGNVDARDGLSDVERKIRQLDEARYEKEREVTQKRNVIADMQNKVGNLVVSDAKDRNAVSVEEYRQLSNELLRVQIEIVKAEALLAGLKNDQPAAPEERKFTEKDYERFFYADKRVAATKEKYDGAKERFQSVKEKVRSLSDPSVQKSLKDIEAARAELDDLWRELRPEMEMKARRGAVPDNGLKAAEGNLAALKAQEASLTDRLNTLQIRQRADGAAAAALEFAKADLSRADQYLDTINRNLADLKLQAREPRNAAEEFQSLNELRVWEVASGRTSRGLVEPGGWYGALAFSRDGSTLIAGGGTPGWSSGFVTLFDLTPRASDAAPEAPF